VKEMTLLLVGFRHTSLLTVHTDLHGQTASGCLCRNRPLQWCLMYLSRLSGCPKSVKETPLQVVFHFWEQKVISRCYLANMEGSRAQSLFVGPKTAFERSCRISLNECRRIATQNKAKHRPYIKQMTVPATDHTPAARLEKDNTNHSSSDTNSDPCLSGGVICGAGHWGIEICSVRCYECVEWMW